MIFQGRRFVGGSALFFEEGRCLFAKKPKRINDVLEKLKYGNAAAG